MSYLNQFILALAAGGALMFSIFFTDKVSRLMEAAFDLIEYRLALREQRLLARRKKQARGNMRRPSFKHNSVADVF